MAEKNGLGQDVQDIKDHATDSFGQLKSDAVRVAQHAAEAGRAGVEQVRSKINEHADTVRSKLNEGSDAVRAKIQDGTETVRTKLHEGAEAARDAAERARVRGNDLLSTVQKQIEENPIQAIAIAAGVGVLVGVLMRRR